MQFAMSTRPTPDEKVPAAHPTHAARALAPLPLKYRPALHARQADAVDAPTVTE